MDIKPYKIKPRDILISEEINKEAIKGIVAAIIAINQDDAILEERYKDFEREPIRLFINSGGGSVYDGIALTDIMAISKTPIHTIAIGHVMSMALWIYSCGDKRFIGNNATLMYHQISGGVRDKNEGIKQEASEWDRLQKICDKACISASSVLQEKLDDIKERKAEWYIPADEAIRLNWAEGYYDEL